jgi:Cdc6-like AAA superfamily ATPase
MAQKTLKQYKEEFEVLNKELENYFNQLNHGNDDVQDKTTDLLEKKEELAIACIQNFQKNDFGYQQLADKHIFIINNFFKEDYLLCHELQKINETFAGTEKHIKSIEIFLDTIFKAYPFYSDYIENCNTKDYNLPYDAGLIWDFIERYNLSGKAYFLLAKLYAQAGYLNEATGHLDTAKVNRFEDFELSYFYPPFNSIWIHSYHCIKDLYIDELDDCKEIYFLGENGVGKTLLLQAIIKSFDDSKISGHKIELENEIQSYFYDQSFRVLEYPNLFAYGTSRFRTGLQNDEYFDKEGHGTLFDRNLLLTDVEWFLKDLQRKELLETGAISLKTVLDLLKEIVDFDEHGDLKIEYDKNEDKFIFIEKATKIKFEHLAEGYRSVMIWLCDLLSRLIENQPYIDNLNDFYGVVLVDEIDMFLHPKWEYSIVKKLREKLPNIQWFFTTHSPILTLGASKDAVFYKLYKDNGITKISEPIKGSQNMTANSLITSLLWRLDTFTTRNIKPEFISSDDYIYQQIHQVISKRIQNTAQLTDKDVIKLIEEELDKIKF